MTMATRRAKKAANKRSVKKVAKKKGAKKSAKKKGAKKRKAAPARAARKTAKKRPAKTARKKPAKKSARKSARPDRATKRAAKKRAPKRRPPLHLVKRVAPKPAPKPRRTKPTPQPFAGAKAGASGKDLALFEMVRARVAVHAAVQGMEARSADQPTAPGKWTPRQMLLHLAYWDHEMTAALEDAYLHDRRPSLTHDDILEINPPAVAELEAQHDWEGAKRLLHLNRERLLESLQSIPEDPADLWAPEHAVGWICRMLTEHDRHHADKLKARREATEDA